MSSLFGIGGGGNVGASGSFYSKSIDQSLRFDASSAYLNFTPSSSTTGTVTISAWVKRSNLGSTEYLFASGAVNARGNIGFNTSDQLFFQGFNSSSANSVLTSSMVFRDVSSWYHIVIECDGVTTTSDFPTNTNVYVNGSTISMTHSTASTPTGGFRINDTQVKHIGALTPTASSYFSGYMAEVHWIDGTALDADNFGETKDGVWVPKEYTGSHGTAGWYLPFSQDTANSASVYFNEDDNGFLSWTDPGTEYVIGSSDDYTLELFFNPTSAEMSGSSYIAGYYKTTSPSGFFAIQTNLSTRNFYLYHGNGAAYTFGTYSVGDVVAGQWHHLAFNRSSGTLRCFLDGAEVGSAQLSNTKTHDIPEFRVNKAHATSNTTFDGYISNVRLVIGSAVYADGSSITVPTSPLTAVTNTKILACTTTTITEDASSNNVTGSSNNSGFFSSSVSPFATSNFYDDASGNNNDWTAENMQDIDVVPDSPTNNWATNNGAMRANITHAEGNLEMTGVATNYDNMASTFMFDVEDSDGWYWEYRSIGNDNSTTIGISTPENVEFNQSDPTNPFSNTTACVSYLGDGQKKIAGTNSSYGDSWTAGDIIGIAVKAGAVYFYKNGTIQNSGTAAATGLTGDYVAAYAINGTNSGTANYGQDSTFAGAVSAGGNSDTNGLGDFKYSVPSGYKALCSTNLPEPAIGPNSDAQADDYFNTVLYTGNASTNAITGVGFQPDWVWLKARNFGSGHAWFDVVRGALKYLASEAASAEATLSDSLTSFDSDGFSLGSNNGVNRNTTTFVSWNWKLGGSSNTFNIDGTGYASASDAGLDGGDITPDGATISTTAGVSIITYTGNGGSNQTIEHGLSSVPLLTIIKDRDSNSSNNNWWFGSSIVGEKYGYFTNATWTGSTAIILPTSGDSTTVTIGRTGTNATNVLENNDNFIMYNFTSIDGFSKIGEYQGNGDLNGTFVYTGFRPAWIMLKEYDGSAAYYIFDTARDPENDDTSTNLQASSSTTEGTSTPGLDILSNGFKLRLTSGAVNGSGDNYIYIAFAEAPFKYANAR